MQQCERKVTKRSEAEDFGGFSCCNSRNKRSTIPTRNPFNLFSICSDKDLHSFGFFSNSTNAAIFQLDRCLWSEFFLLLLTFAASVGMASGRIYNILFAENKFFTKQISSGRFQECNFGTIVPNSPFSESPENPFLSWVIKLTPKKPKIHSKYT